MWTYCPVYVYFTRVSVLFTRVNVLDQRYVNKCILFIVMIDNSIILNNNNVVDFI